MKQVYTGEIVLHGGKLPERDYEILRQVYLEAPECFETQPDYGLIRYMVAGQTVKFYRKFGTHIASLYGDGKTPITAREIYDVECDYGKKALNGDVHVVCIGVTEENHDLFLEAAKAAHRTIVNDVDETRMPVLVKRVHELTEKGERAAMLYNAKLAQSRGVKSDVYRMIRLCASSPSFVVIEPQTLADA